LEVKKMRVLSIALLLGSIALLALVAVANWGFLSGHIQAEGDTGLYQEEYTGENIDMIASPILNPDLIRNLQQYRDRYLLIGLVVLAVAFVLGLQGRGAEF
jgi:hypothetical protein